MAKDLFLVVGGELKDLAEPNVFRNENDLHVVGVFPHDEAKKIWKGWAQLTVDNALMRYFIIPLNKAA